MIRRGGLHVTRLADCDTGSFSHCSLTSVRAYIDGGERQWGEISCHLNTDFEVTESRKASHPGKAEDMAGWNSRSMNQRNILHSTYFDLLNAQFQAYATDTWSTEVLVSAKDYTLYLSNFQMSDYRQPRDQRRLLIHEWLPYLEDHHATYSTLD